VLGVDYVLQNFDEPLRSMLKASYKLLEFSALDFRERVSKVFQATKNLVKEVKGDQPELPYRNLLDTLVGFWDSNASLPRDKVFALLNLSKGSSVKPDYSKDKSDSDIFKDVAFSVIAESGRLDILTLCNCARETPNQLPSWTPDWANFDRPSMALQLNQRYRAYALEMGLMRQYTASRGSTALPPQRTGNILSLSGYLVDQLVEVGPRFPFADSDEDFSM
jgi:hypothetical protein